MLQKRDAFRSSILMSTLRMVAEEVRFSGPIDDQLEQAAELELRALHDEGSSDELCYRAAAYAAILRSLLERRRLGIQETETQRQTIKAAVS